MHVVKILAHLIDSKRRKCDNVSGLEEWTEFVIDKTGSARRISEEIESALKQYMRKSESFCPNKDDDRSLTMQRT
jgi:hypothetical protein